MGIVVVLLGVDNHLRKDSDDREDDHVDYRDDDRDDDEPSQMG